MQTGPIGFEQNRGMTWKSIFTSVAAGVFGLAHLIVPAVAADIFVDRVNDAGAGSLRQGLAGAQSGDILQFLPILDGTTLVDGPTLAVKTNVTFLDPTGITVTDNHAFTLAAPVTISTNPPVSQAFPLTVDWAGRLTLNGVLSDASVNGSLIKNGTGTLVLSNSNTYTGGTTINSGTIEVASNDALGTGALNVNTLVGTRTLKLSDGLNLRNAISLASDLDVSSAAGTTNQLSGVISGTAATGVLNWTGNGRLILSGSNTFVGGVTVANDSTLNLQNSAALGTGTLTTAGSLRLELASGLTVGNDISLGDNLIGNVDSGTSTLSGDISQTAVATIIKTGAGTLALTGTNSYTGGAIVSQGTLQGNSSSLPGNIINNDRLVLNQPGFGTYGGNISGTGTLLKTGSGTLDFSGTSSLLTMTNVYVGDLQVTGTVSGPITIVSRTGALSGTGDVGSVTNHGYIQPGTTNIGTLTVNGDFTQTETGITEIKMDSAGNTPGTNNDLLTITGQSQLGGNLNVLPVDGGLYTAGTKYTILNAAGGVTGRYALPSTTLPTFGIQVTYGPNDVTFELLKSTSLAAAAQTANQAAVGAAMDNIALTSTGSLFSMINVLSVQSPTEQQQSMNQLSGEVFGGLQNLGLQIGDQFQQKVTNAMISNGLFLTGIQAGRSSHSNLPGQPITDGWSRGWVQGYGFGGSFGSDGNGAAMNFSQGGAFYGIDLGDDDTGRIGIAGGNSYASFNDGFDTSGQIVSYQVGIYSLIQDDISYLLGTANYGNNAYETKRTVSIDGYNQLLRASFSGDQFGTNIETGLKLSAGIVHIQPLVGLQFLLLSQQGFQESGGPAALTVDRNLATSLRANVGARLMIDPWTGPGDIVWTPFTYGRFVSDVLDNDRLVNASFANSPAGGAFTTHGTRIGPNYGVIGQGLEARVSENWSLFANGDILFGDQISMGTGSIGAISYW